MENRKIAKQLKISTRQLIMLKFMPPSIVEYCYHKIKEERKEQRMKEAIFRTTPMPPHCGNCLWHLWDEGRSICLHHWKISDDELIEELLDDPDGLKAFGAHNFADTSLGHVQDNADWLPYDAVCNYWSPKIRGEFAHKHEREIYEQMYNEYHDRVDVIIKAEGIEYDTAKN